jgi:hypothetical protein
MYGGLHEENELSFGGPDCRAILHADYRRDINYPKVRMKLFIPCHFGKPLFARSMKQQHIRAFLDLCQGKRIVARME